MSTEIDEKVVSMQFDNSRFESNVKTSMSTIEKLKAALNFDGVSKSFDKLNESSTKVNMNGLSNALDTVHAKFSALEVIGVTALANITNSAVNAGKRLVKSLSIDQVSAGWSKYEEITGATQTIMSATGKDIDYVTERLEKLNWFTDETSYNLTDMVSNVGKFTSAGVDLDKAVTAMQGIATEAALSGANAQQASRAMYNFSQAMGIGSVKVQDWMSIENANMATKEFKETIIETAKELGYLNEVYEFTDKGLANKSSNFSFDGPLTFQNFRQSLAGGWFDSDVLTKTLEKYGSFADKLQETMAKTDLDMTSDLLNFVKQYKNGTLDIEKASYEAGLTSKEFTKILKELSSEEYELGMKAFIASQEAKTFTEAINATKDAVSTGWMNIFETVFGNYEEAKVMWTKLANDLWEIFAGPIKSKNEVLSGAFDSKWSTLTKTIKHAGLSVDDFQKTLDKTAKTHGIDLNKLIKEYGSLEGVLSAGAISSGLMKEAFTKWTSSAKTATTATKATGDELKKFQNIVNKVINGEFGNGEKRVKALTKAGWDYKTVQGLVNKQVKNGKITIDDLSDSQLKSVGYTDEQIKALRELGDQALDSNSEISKLLDSVSRPSGRELFVGSLENTLHSFMALIDIVKKAWGNIFEGVSSEDIYNILKAINQLSEKGLKGIDKNSDKIRRSLEGLFAVIDLITDITGGALKIALKFVLKVLGSLNLDVLDVTAGIGDALVRFRDWVENSSLLAKGLDKAADAVGKFVIKQKKFIEDSKVIDKIKNGYKTFKDVSEETFKKLTKDVDFSTEGIKQFFRNFKEVLKEAKDSAIFDEIRTKLVNFFTDVNDKIKEIPVIGTIVDRLEEALSSGYDKIKETLTNIKDEIETFIENLKNSDNFSFDGFKEGLENFKQRAEETFNNKDDVFATESNFVNNFKTSVKTGMEESSKSVVDFGGIVKRIAEELKDSLSENIELSDLVAIGLSIAIISAMKKLATAIGKLTPPVTDFKNLLGSITGIFTEIKKDIKALKVIGFIVSIAIAIGILAAAIVAMSFIKVEVLWSTVGAITVLIGILTGLSVALAKMMDVFDTGKISTMMIGFGVSIALIAAALKLLSTIDYKESWAAAVALGGIIAAMFVVTTILGHMKLNNNNVTKTLIPFAVSLYMVAITLNKLSKIPTEEIGKALKALSEIFIGMIALQLLTGASKGRDKGVAMLSYAASMLLIVHALKKLGNTKATTISKGLLAIEKMFGIFAGLMLVSILAGKNADKAGVGMLGMVLSIAILTKIIDDLASMNSGDIKKGLTPLITFFALFAVVVASTAFAGENASKAGFAILEMSAALVILSGAMKILATMNPDKLLSTTTALAVLILSLAAAIKATEKVEKSAATVTALTIAVGVIAASIAVLSLLKPEKALTSAASLSIVLLALASSVYILGKIENKLGKAIGAMFAMMPMMVGIGAVLVLMSKLKTENALANAAGISLTMIALAGVVKILSTIKWDINKNVLKSMGLVAVFALAAALALSIIAWAGASASQALAGAAGIAIVMGAMVAVVHQLESMQGLNGSVLATLGWLVAISAGIALAISILSLLNVSASQALAGAAGISLVLVAMAGAVKILSSIQNVSSDAIIGMLEMGVIALMASFALGILGQCGVSASQALAGATGISLMLVAMSAALKILSTITSLKVSSLLGLGIMAAVAWAVSHFIISELSEMNPAAVLPNAVALSGLLLALSAAVDILALGGLLAFPAILSGIAGLIVLICGVAFITGLIGAIAQSETIAKWINTGVPLLEKLGEALGGFFGGLINGVLKPIITSLPEYGESISGFFEKLQPGLTLMKNIKKEDLEGAKSIAALLAVITAEEMVTSITNFLGLTGEGALEAMAETLVLFGGAMVEFYKTVNGNIDADIVNDAANAGLALAKLNSAIPPTGGKLQEWLGTKDLALFSDNIGKFADAIVLFAIKIAALPEGLIEKVSAVAAAGQALAELNNNIPATGGKLQDWLGTKDLALFSENIKTFATAMVEFCDTIKPLKIDSKKVEAVTNAGLALAGLNDALPKTGGTWQDLFGEKDFALFSTNIKLFADGMVEFATKIGSAKFDDDKIDTAMNIGTALADLNDKLPKTGGIWQDIWGGKDLGGFGKAIKKLGQGLADFAIGVKDITPASAKAGLDAAEMIYNFYTTLDPTGGIWDSVKELFGGSQDNTLAIITSSMSSLGTALKKYSDSCKTIDFTKTAQSLTFVTNLGDKLIDIDDMDLEGTEADNFKMNVKSLGDGVKGYVAYIRGIDFAAVDKSISFIKTFIGLLNQIEGKVYSPATIRNALKALGEGLLSYSNSMNAANLDLAKIFASCVAADAIIAMMKRVPENVKDVSKFISNIKKLGTALVDFSDKVVAIDANKVKSTIATLNTALGNIDNIIKFDAKIKNLGSKAMTSFTNSIINGGPKVQNAIKRIMSDAIKNIQSYEGKFLLQGMYLTQYLTKGISMVKKNLFSSVLSSSVSEIRLKYRDFYNAGNYVATGFSKGISDNTYKAKKAAVNMANVTLAATRNILKIASPSKAFGEIGDYSVLGYVNHLMGGLSLVSEASSKVGSTAIDALGDAMNQALNLMSDDAEYNPVITPIIDLSEVAASQNAINNLFSDRSMLIDGSMTTSRVMSRHVYKDPDVYNDGNVIRSIHELRSDLNDLNESISNMKLVLNTGIVAGAITNDIDKNLGRKYAHRERGI